MYYQTTKNSIRLQRSTYTFSKKCTGIQEGFYMHSEKSPVKTTRFSVISTGKNVTESRNQITIVRGTLPAQHVRNTVRAQCGTYASHFAAGTYVGGICLALCNRHLFIYIYILNIIDIRPFFDNKNVNLC